MNLLRGRGPFFVGGNILKAEALPIKIGILQRGGSAQERVYCKKGGAQGRPPEALVWGADWRYLLGRMGLRALGLRVIEIKEA